MITEPLRIEIIQSGEKDFMAAVNGLMAGPLTADEALGVVASAIFGLTPLYVRDRDEWLKFHQYNSFKAYDHAFTSLMKPGREQ